MLYAIMNPTAALWMTWAVRGHSVHDAESTRAAVHACRGDTDTEGRGSGHDCRHFLEGLSMGRCTAATGVGGARLLELIGKVCVVNKHDLVAVGVGRRHDFGADARDLEGLLRDGAPRRLDRVARLVHVVCADRHLQPRAAASACRRRSGQTGMRACVATCGMPTPQPWPLPGCYAPQATLFS